MNSDISSRLLRRIVGGVQSRPGDIPWQASLIQHRLRVMIYDMIYSTEYFVVYNDW